MKTNHAQKNTSNGWQLVKLGVVCDVSAGGTPSTEVSEYWENGNVPWANSAEINKKNIYETENFITEKGLKNSSAKLVPVNSVLIALAGQGSTRGKVAVNKISLATNQSIAFFTPKKDINYSFLRSDLERRYQELRSISAGDGGRGGLNLQILKSLKIKLPPLPEQDRIVSILETWDKSIEKITQKIKAKNQIKKALMRDLLTSKIRLTGFTDTWKILKLGEVGKVSMCKRIFQSETLFSGDIPFFKIGTFGKAPDAFISKEIYQEYKNKYSFPKKGEILISASGTIGRTVVYDGNPAYFQDSNIVWISNDEKKVINSFLYYVYKITEWHTDSSTIARLYNDNLRRIKIHVPSIEEQEEIAEILITADKEITELEKKLSILKEQKRYLLNNLITGTIRTPETLSTKLTK